MDYKLILKDIIKQRDLLNAAVATFSALAELELPEGLPEPKKRGRPVGSKSAPKADATGERIETTAFRPEDYPNDVLA